MSCVLDILHVCQINLMFLSSNIFIWGLFQANIDPVNVTVCSKISIIMPPLIISVSAS